MGAHADVSDQSVRINHACQRDAGVASAVARPRAGLLVDAVDRNDLLNTERGWVAYTYRGKMIVPHGKPTGLCATAKEAVTLANKHAQKTFPKLTAKGKWSRYCLTGGEQYREHKASRNGACG